MSVSAWRRTQSAGLAHRVEYQTAEPYYASGASTRYVEPSIRIGGNRFPSPVRYTSHHRSPYLYDDQYNNRYREEVVYHPDNIQRSPRGYPRTYTVASAHASVVDPYTHSELPPYSTDTQHGWRNVSHYGGSGVVSGRHKALLIGINYKGREGLELAGCENDAKCLAKFLEMQGWPTDSAHMKVMHEDATYDNVLRAIHWLTEGARQGDALFFGFSGHGMQKRDFSGDEADGLDEILICSDGGHLSDDTLFSDLVQKVPSGALLTAIIDCCHSGTVLDLPYSYHLTRGGIRQSTPSMAQRHQTRGVGQTILFSACDDSQESADLDFATKANKSRQQGAGGTAVAGGACINSLLSVLAEHGTDLKLLYLYQRMTDHLQQRRRLSQLPQISSVHELDILSPFFLSPGKAPLKPLPRIESSTEFQNPIMALLAKEGKLATKRADNNARTRGWFDNAASFAGSFSNQLDDVVTQATGNEQLGDFIGGAVNNFAEGGGIQSFIPDPGQIIEALKEALEEGAEHAVGQASREGGFLDDMRIKIPWPQDASTVENTLRTVGAGGQCDSLVETLNRSAEQAAGGALQIFVDCIFGMGLDDGKAILQGGDSAATEYMRGNTLDQLTDMMTPIITDAMEAFVVTRYWDDIINMYNAIPLVPDIEFDLVRYVVQKALEGLFTLVADKERDIRENPQGAIHGLVQQVFSWGKDGCPE